MDQALLHRGSSAPPPARTKRTEVKEGKPGYLVEFIGPKGKIIDTSMKTKASCPVNLPYLRCKVTRRIKQKDGDLIEYYAWVQPVFTDDRTKDSE